MISFEGNVAWVYVFAPRFVIKIYKESHCEYMRNEVRKIEEMLRALLAYADRDHPILRQLERTKELALR